MVERFLFADRADMNIETLLPVPVKEYGSMLGQQYIDKLAGMMFSREQINECVSAMADSIKADYDTLDADDGPLVVTPLLNGAMFFAADLMASLYMPVELDTLKVETYGSGMQSSKEVKIHKDFSRSVKDRHVLLVEDIVDTGWTLDFVINGLLKHKSPKSVRVATLLDKSCKRETDIQPAYVGFRIPDMYVVGYGLDHSHGLRNLPFVAVYKG